MPESFTIAVCTLGENKTLELTLKQLVHLKGVSDFEIDLLVIVNKDEFNFLCESQFRVVFEPKRGYSSARNAAVKNCLENSSLIFIDDDEVPTLRWLNALVEKHQKFPRDIVFGPVYSQSNQSIGSYRRNFEAIYHALPDESVVKQCGSGNMLIPSHLIESNVIEFDPFFDFSGGEDTDLCFRLRRQGIKIRYAKNAFLIEIEPERRIDSEYLDARFLKEIVTYSLVIRRNSSAIVRARRFSILLVRIISYGALAPFRKALRKTALAYWRSMQALITGKNI